MPIQPDLPVPAGATADPWSDHTDDEFVRGLTWTRHDTDKIGVAVDGWQTATGTITAGVSLYDCEGKELSAADARRLAAALMDAADHLDRLNGTETAPQRV